MIRTMLADDSPSFLAALATVLSLDGELEIVGTVPDGRRAADEAVRLQPDLVVLDLLMPHLDGLGAARAIARSTSSAIVIMSSTVEDGSSPLVFEALRAGAVEVLAKPRDLNDPRSRRALCATLKAMARLKRVQPRRSVGLPARAVEAGRRWVAIGSSTGGPPVVAAILASLPADLTATVLVAQHLASGFAAGFETWLSRITSLPVHRVRQAEPARPGHVYLPDDDVHLVVTGNQVTTRPRAGDEVAPSVDALFGSLEDQAAAAVGVILTGMGSDGAAGMAALRARGAHTVAQDEATSLVYGMPRAAAERGAAVESLPADGIAARLVELTGRARR
jgi:chemotaxis response regulator CheB